MRQVDRLGLSGDLGPLLQELLGLSRNEPGYLLVDLGDAGKRAAALYTPQVGHPAAHGDGTQPVIPGRREHRCPAAEAVPDHGDPLPVNGWKVAILEVVDDADQLSFKCADPDGYTVEVYAS